MDAAVILPISNQPGHYVFSCPGCRAGHKINTDPANGPPCHTLTGPPEKPTIRASVFANPDGKPEQGPKCHSFVTDGQIQYLGDCTHELAGQTVPLPVL